MKKNNLTSVFLFLFTIIIAASCTPKEDSMTEFGKKYFDNLSPEKTDIKFMPAEQSELRTQLPDTVTAERFFVTYGEDRMLTGILFTPAGKTDKALLFLHWLGGITNIDKGAMEFYSEAAGFASDGYLCAVPDGFFPWANAPADVESDYAAFKRQIVEYRLVLDIMTGRMIKDDYKVGIVGHDYGGMYALVLAQVDNRIDFICSLTPTDTYWSWNSIITSFQSGGDFQKKYMDIFRPFDPEIIISNIDKPLFLQFADADEYVSEETRKNITDNTNTAAIIKIYESNHSLNRSQIAADERRDWIKSM
ncbi:MAG: dienelactone hydrolase family protein [Spirochaetes bacterium]|nr:dienelactone hydrolase family protein [Spirochaetota bacterium]